MPSRLKEKELDVLLSPDHPDDYAGIILRYAVTVEPGHKRPIFLTRNYAIETSMGSEQVIQRQSGTDQPGTLRVNRSCRVQSLRAGVYPVKTAVPNYHC